MSLPDPLAALPGWIVLLQWGLGWGVVSSSLLKAPSQFEEQGLL